MRLRDCIADRARLALDVFLHGPQIVDAEVVDGEITRPPIPKDSPWDEAAMVATRTESALAIMDDDVIGFVLVLVRDPRDGDTKANLDLSCVLDHPMWDSVLEAVDRSAVAFDG